MGQARAMAEADLSMYNIDIMRVSSCILLPRTLRVFERHAHRSHEAHYVIAGRGSFEVGKQQLAVRAAEKGNPNSLSDAGVAGLCAMAGAEAAWYNVLINLNGIEGDQEWVAATRERASSQARPSSCKRRLASFRASP